METLMETFVLYIRLVLYPLLAYTIMVDGFSVNDCNGEERAKSKSVYMMFAFFFMMLWGSSIIYFITRNNTLVVDYNSYALLPVTTILLFTLWYRILKRCKKLHDKVKSETIGE
jgi:hypothetical protein